MRSHLGYFIQFYGYIRGFLKLIRFGYTIQQSNDLKETNQLRFEYYLAMAALISNKGVSLSPKWPKNITKDERGHFSFIPKFDASYHVLQDFTHQAYFENMSEDKISLLKKERDDVITVGHNSPILLSENIDLKLFDTPFCT